VPEPRRTPLEPVEADAVPVIAIGTIAWAAVLVVLLVLRLLGHRPGAHDDWVWIAVAGVGLGFLGIRTVRRRRTALRREAQTDPSTGQTGPNHL
jgi:positive regulator of sigma E activity